MITKRKSILVTSIRLDFFEKFEALEYVSDLTQVKDVWEKNKTPILVKSSGKITYDKYNIINIPEELIDNIEGFIDFCHSHEFECGEYLTGNVFDTKHERCFLCELAKRKGFSDLERYNKFVDKSVDCIIYESQNFYVVPELGALKKGYLMIVPKKHILSVAQFPEEFREEYAEVCKDVEHILKNTFNAETITFMEHGSGPSGKTSHKKSIVHAHTHVVADFTLKPHFQDMVKLKPCEDISIAKNVHYFSYQEGTDNQLMIAMDSEVYVQRQFPRQVMAEELGLAPDQYNWRCYDFDEITGATLFYLCKYLRENENNKRIVKRTKGFVRGFPNRPKKVVH